MRWGLIFGALGVLSGCSGKTVCANGDESFRPVYDPENSCKIRIRQVMVGSEVKMPASIALDIGSVNWLLDWAGSEFRNGQVELGHFILKPDTAEKP